MKQVNTPCNRMLPILTLLALTLGTTTATAQTAGVLKLSTGFDSANAPSSYPFPGFNGAFRQQILVAATRLSTLQGKSLSGFWVRRNLKHTDALTGGLVDIEIRVSRAAVSPELASETFASNTPTTQHLAFQGRIAVPNSPSQGSTPTPWSTSNSVQIIFTQAFPYSGGDLCFDVSARPVIGSEPRFWFIDYDRGNYSGTARPFGLSCGPVKDKRAHSLYATTPGVQIGNTVRIKAIGRPGGRPMFLLGATDHPTGVDLSIMGAPGCRQYVAFYSLLPLGYGPLAFPGAPAALQLDVQIPHDVRLLGASAFVQIAENELRLSAAERTNPAGLTTSNGLELKISSVVSGLGMSIVTSSTVTGSAAMPTRGRVDVTMGPVLRLLY